MPQSAATPTILPVSNGWAATAAFLLAAAVALGAFGAHGLKSRLDEYRMSVYEKAVFYHFVHALGLLLVALLGRAGSLGAAQAGRIGWLLTAGIALFSGSLYVLAITDVRMLGAVTPLGGVSFIAAWVWLGFELFKNSR
jgi:uncharacterized membrane protein YgdD (TMEM256/DUF423 family)